MWSSDTTLNFEVFSVAQSVDEAFNIYGRLGNSFYAPVFESYSKTLNRRLKNFLPEDVRSLLLQKLLHLRLC